jgi:hypothetical protein
MLGSARFASRPAWLGPPYTQVTQATKSLLKRKNENMTGDYML